MPSTMNYIRTQNYAMPRTLMLDDSLECKACEGGRFVRRGPKDYYLKCLACVGTGIEAIPLAEVMRCRS
jgi:hypothetical protein